MLDYSGEAFILAVCSIKRYKFVIYGKWTDFVVS